MRFSTQAFLLPGLFSLLLSVHLLSAKIEHMMQHLDQELWQEARSTQGENVTNKASINCEEVSSYFLG